MAARIVRSSFSRCARFQASFINCSNSRCFVTSQILLVRGTRPLVDREDLVDETSTDDDFYGITSDHGVVKVDDPVGDKHERLRRFSHLIRSRDAKVSDETVLTADFGTIRYDTDNKARYHGQYEDDRPLDDFVLGIYEKGGSKSKKRNKVSDIDDVGEEERPKPEWKVASGRKAAKKANDRGETWDQAEPVTTIHRAVNLASRAVEELPLRAKAGSRPSPAKNRRVSEVDGVSPRAVAQTDDSVSKEAAHKSNFSASRESGPNFVQFDTPDPYRPSVATQPLPNRNANEEETSRSDSIHSLRSSTPEKSEVVSSRFSKYPAAFADNFSREDPVRSLSGIEHEPKIHKSKGRVGKQKESSKMATDDARAESKEARYNNVPASEHVRQSEPADKVDSGFDTGSSRKSKRAEDRKRARVAVNDRPAADEVPHDETGESNPTAYEYLRKSTPHTLKLDSKGFLILKSEVRPDLTTMLKSEVISLLQQRVLYDANDVLVLDKPYGMICHGSAEGVGDARVLSHLLPDLSSALYPRTDTKLYTVHRLDRDVTGVIVLAKTQRMADLLQTLFEEHNVKKTYHAITFNVPDNPEATIDMPLAEGSVGSAKRMVICPKLEPEYERLVPKFRKTYEAVTHYRVLASHGRAAFIELTPETGVKHQLRVHLGFGLRCPILGDHKYSHLRYIGPQRLSGDLLARLTVQQTKARHIPMHLHASAILIPEIVDGQNLVVRARLPYHFAQNLRRLKLNRY